MRQRRTKYFIFLGVVLLAAVFVSLPGCTTDCLYRSYTTEDGQSACARVCPLTDEEGNEVVDSNGKPVFEEPEAGEDVHPINCDPFRNVNSTSGTTTSTTSG